MTPLPPKLVAGLVSAVTRKMMEVPLELDEQPPPLEHLLWRSAAVTFAGERPFTVALSSDEEGCVALAALMVGDPDDEISADGAGDALRELANMTAGALKTYLRLEQPIGLPHLPPPGRAPLPPAAAPEVTVLRSGERLRVAVWLAQAEPVPTRVPEVLVVDDSRSVRTIVRKEVEALGLELVEAQDGQQGLEALTSRRFDLVLLDVTMPRMDGPTMLEELRRSGDATPVIMLTSESSRSVLARVTELGVTDYVLKPFERGVLRDKVAAVIRAAARAA